MYNKIQDNWESYSLAELTLRRALLNEHVHFYHNCPTFNQVHLTIF